MASYYQATRDPRKPSVAGESSRKRQRTEDTGGEDVKIGGTTDADRDTSNTVAALEKQIKELQLDVSSKLNKNAKLTSDNAAMAKERNHYHEKEMNLTQQHKEMMVSLEKRVKEKHKIMEENAALLQESADLKLEHVRLLGENSELKSEKALYAKNMEEKDKRIKELEAMLEAVMSAQRTDALELQKFRKGIEELNGMGRNEERGKSYRPGQWAEDTATNNPVGDGAEQPGKSTFRGASTEIKTEIQDEKDGRGEKPGYVLSKNTDSNRYRDRERPRTIPSNQELRDRYARTGSSSSRENESQQERTQNISRSRNPQSLDERERLEGEVERADRRYDSYQPPSRYSRGMQPPTGPRSSRRR